MMIIVSDTTAISNLIQIGKFELLEQLFGEITIPIEVHEELLALSNLGIDINNLLNVHWVNTISTQKNKKFIELSTSLDFGEAAAISLAIELNADLIIIDELKGRKVATQNGLKIIGTLGVLIEAKNKGLITTIEPLLIQLREVGFWISQALFDKVIEVEKQISKDQSQPKG